MSQAAAISGAAVLPTILIGCGSADSAVFPMTSRQQVLAAGTFGELQKPWYRSDTLTLRRPDGTTASYGGSHKALNVPTSAAVSPDGSFWVADTGNRRILHLSHSLQPIGEITEVSGKRFSRPTGVAILEDGRLAVSDQLLGKVAVASPDSGQGIWTGISADDHVGTGWVPHWETETDHRVLEDPRFIHAAPDGKLVVLDISVARLVLFSSSTGQALDAIRLPGRPADIAIGPDGACYVFDKVKKSVSQVSLKTRSVDAVLSAAQISQFPGSPDRIVWSIGSGPEISNLLISYR
ncbi:MAG: hypothetical protein IAE92_08975 [Burkholderiaceae bacterium]|nr:hypothetical protein [Burkholderiaceae bacterium]